MRTFNWIQDRLLAGSGRPGLLGDLDDDLAWLEGIGIQHVVSLTRRALELPPGSKMRVTREPIPDMGTPSTQQALELCEFIVECMGRSEPVLVHCRAGLGRTGTILACALVSRGAMPTAAVVRLRGISQYYIQTESQERFVEHFAEHLRGLSEQNTLPAGFRPPPTPHPVEP